MVPAIHRLALYAPSYAESPLLFRIWFQSIRDLHFKKTGVGWRAPPECAHQNNFAWLENAEAKIQEPARYGSVSPGSENGEAKFQDAR